MARLGLRTIKKPNLIGSFGEPSKPEAVAEEVKVSEPIETTSKTTDDLRINYGNKSKESSTDNLRANTGKTTEVISGSSTDKPRLNYGNKSEVKSKTTDTTTDETPGDLRKNHGKTTDIHHLVGFQRTAFFWIVAQAKNFGSSDRDGNRITAPINGNTFASSVLFKSYKQAKDILYELKVSGFLTNHFAKHGRGGFVQFLIQKDLYQACLLVERSDKSTDFLRENYGNSTGKSTDKSTEPALSSVIKSSLKENTKTEAIEFVIPENLRVFGVGQKNLVNIMNDGALSFEEIQSSLDQFSHDTAAGVVKKNHLNLLMGILRKKNVYISASYSQQTEKELSEHLARLAAYQENKNKLAEAKRAEEFANYLEQNPDFLNEVKKSTGGNFNLSEEMLKKMAYSRWSEADQPNDL